MCSLNEVISIDDHDSIEDDTAHIIDEVEKTKEMKVLSNAVREHDKSKPTASPQAVIVPFHLFDTKASVTSSDSFRRSAKTKQYFQTLRETLGMDNLQPQTLDEGRKRNFQWLVLSNFLIDFNYFLQQTLPEILLFYRVVVFYGEAMDSNVGMDLWKELLSGSNNTVEFIRLVPSDPPRTITNPLSIRIPFGVHHTKMFLIGYLDTVRQKDHSFERQSMVRVVVHTANLIKGDIEWKTQGIYNQDFPLKNTDKSKEIVTKTEKYACSSTILSKRKRNDIDGEKTTPLTFCKKQSANSNSANNCGWPFEDEDPQPFEDDLVNYLESYQFVKRQIWSLSDGNDSSTSNTLTIKPMSLLSLIRQYDFSKAYAVLIPSVPGKHVISTDNHFGYLKLRKAVIEHVCSHVGHQQTISPSLLQSPPPIICQFSSIGSLTPKWLDSFLSAIDYQSTHLTDPCNNAQTIHSKSSKKINARCSFESKIKIVWPTVREIRNSIEGYIGGGSVPGMTKNVCKDFLQPLYHQWSGRNDQGNNNNTDLLNTSYHVPHIKTFVQPSVPVKGTPQSIEWLCLTSHNLSKAAWGEVQTSPMDNRKSLFIRHWEMGVFFSPATLAKCFKDHESECQCCCFTLLPYTGANDEEDVMRLKSKDEIIEVFTSVVVPLPYDINPTKYTSNDVPWTIDGCENSLHDDFGVLG